VTPATVFLVGAGPGDPGLITLRGRDLLASCDCVVHDYLVNPAVVALAAPGAERHFVGKRGLKSSTPQGEINTLLISLAARHRRIVRLKGGDPFLFGRGGEECAALVAAGIPFEVVPGVTSGIAAPAYAGIPVTHRASSSAVGFVTGHQQTEGVARSGGFAWSQVAQVETIVLYMGMHKLAANCAALIAAGRDGATPAAAVQWGTWPRQRCVTGTLATLPALVAQAGLGAPAITVIGAVVRERERLRWFDDPRLRPLCGRRILVTRAREQASSLVHLLREAGAEVIEAPLARYVEPADPAALDRALGALAGFAWCAFTSANAVEFTARRLAALGLDARAFAGCRLAAVGPATAAALARLGLRADLVPAQADAAGLAAALLAAGCASALLPQADNARPELRALLAAAGCAVTAVTAYRAETLPPPPPPEGALDGIALASAATVDRLVAAWGVEELRARCAAGCRLWAIGPTTAAAVAAHGLALAAVAEEATTAGRAAAVVADLGAR
jgi:uroporphyrinogen III methyltransferase/synthase